MICFVSALMRCRVRQSTGTLYAVLFGMAALLPWERVLAQSVAPAATSVTNARRDSVARANRIARAKARRAAARAKRAAGPTPTRVARAGAVPAVSPRSAATGSQTAGGSGGAASSAGSAATPASSRPTAAAPTTASAAVVASGATSATGRSTGSAGAPVRTRENRGSPTASKRKGATSVADGGPALGVYGGASNAGFGFGIGPVLGAAWRFAAPATALRLRADVMASHYSQTASALAGGAPITQSSSLTHLGATLSAELSLSNRRTLRPYLLAGGGVFRFQASGPSGSNGTIANGVFKSTTDIAGIGGVGLQLNPRVYIEARYLTVGDFHTIPITAGVRF